MPLKDILSARNPHEQPGLSNAIKKSNRGKQAKIGNQFQKEIYLACLEYQKMKLAYIQQFAVPTQWIPKNPKTGKGGFLMHKEKTGFDFCGAYKISEIPDKVLSWTPIFIEAKTTEHGDIDVWQDKSGIKTHQLNEMLWLEEAGLRAEFFWQVRAANNIVYILKPSQIIEMIGTKKTLKISDCEDAKVPRLIKTKFHGEEMYDFLDFLE